MGTKDWALISKSIEFDAAHRVPRHGSKCRNVHGHRYKVTAFCRGTIVTEHGAADEGMLVDFGDLKQFMITEIHDVLDHGIMIYRQDVNLLEAMFKLQEFEADFIFRIEEFPYVPTAENIARWCFGKLNPLVEHHFRENLILDRVEVQETPTSMASYPETRHL